jgi:hypothetical protein
MMAQHDPEGQGELARRAERIELAKWAELTKRKDRADLIEYVKRAGPMSGTEWWNLPEEVRLALDKAAAERRPTMHEWLIRHFWLSWLLAVGSLTVCWYVHQGGYQSYPYLWSDPSVICVFLGGALVAVSS